jgi:hypothetical protein
MAQIVSQGEPLITAIFTSSIVDGVVDNLSRAYFLRVSVEENGWPGIFEGGLAVRSVVITYTTQEAD